MCFVDACTLCAWVYYMKNKSKVYSIFIVFQRLLQSLFGKNQKKNQKDGGLEFDNASLLTYFQTCGISFPKSFPKPLNKMVRWNKSTIIP